MIKLCVEEDHLNALSLFCTRGLWSVNPLINSIKHCCDTHFTCWSMHVILVVCLGCWYPCGRFVMNKIRLIWFYCNNTMYLSVCFIQWVFGVFRWLMLFVWSRFIYDLIEKFNIFKCWKSNTRATWTVGIFSCGSTVAFRKLQLSLDKYVVNVKWSEMEFLETWL